MDENRQSGQLTSSGNGQQVFVSQNLSGGSFLAKLLGWLRRIWYLITSSWRYRVIAIVAACVVVGGITTFVLVSLRSLSESPLVTDDIEERMMDTDGDGTPDTMGPDDGDSEVPDSTNGGNDAANGGSGGGTPSGSPGGSAAGNGGGSGNGNGNGGGGPGTGDCSLPKYPTPDCTGVPAGWSPGTTIEGELFVTTDGAVIENHLVTGYIVVQANNVTIRNTRTYGGITNNVGNTVFGPLLIEDSEVVPPPGTSISNDTNSAIGISNYTCRRCKILHRIEGWRISSDTNGSGPVVIEHSYARIHTDLDFCAEFDPHGDGIQGFFGSFATINHNTIDQRNDPCHTAPIFIADESEGANVTDNVLAGGGFTLRLLSGTFPTVTGNKIVDGTWAFGPVDTLGTCDHIGTWSGNATVNFDFATGTIINQVSPLNDCA